MTPAWNTWTPQRAAKIAGAAYLLTYAPVYSWLMVYPKLFVAGDFALTSQLTGIDTDGVDWYVA